MAANRCEVAANLLDLFRLVVPQAVVNEIETRDPAFPLREYPYATLFRHLRHHMDVVPAAESPPPLNVFGPGEAAALALALDRGYLVLVNERRAASHAANLGLRVITIPAVIVRLHLGGVISRQAAHRKLTLAAQVTTPAHVAKAREMVDNAQLP